MQSNQASPRVNDVGGETPAYPDDDTLRARRSVRRAAAQVPFYRDLRAIHTLLVTLCGRLEAFADSHSGKQLAKQLAALSVVTPEMIRDGTIESYVEPVDHLTADARGYLWASEVFLSFLDSHMLPDVVLDGASEAGDEAHDDANAYVELVGKSR